MCIKTLLIGQARIDIHTNRGRCCLTPLYQAVGRSSIPITTNDDDGDDENNDDNVSYS